MKPKKSVKGGMIQRKERKRERKGGGREPKKEKKGERKGSVEWWRAKKKPWGRGAGKKKNERKGGWKENQKEKKKGGRRTRKRERESGKSWLQTLLLAEVTVPVVDPQDAAVCLLVGAAIAGHQDIVDVRNCQNSSDFILTAQFLIMALLARSLLRRASSSNRFAGGIGGAVWRRWMSDEAAGYHLSGGPAYMRGAVFWEANKPLSIEDFNMPRPKAGEVLIKTKACGVCHSDLHVIKGEIPFASPCVVGHEITGEVVEHGPPTDTHITKRFPVGAHVVGAFIMPCGSCFFCTRGQDDLCEDFFAYNRAKGTLYDGETRLFLRSNGKPVFMYSMGGMAEYCVVPAHGLTNLPDSLPYTESAILGCAVFTAYGAMAHAAEVRRGDSVAVIGIGGVGSSCLQIARAFGASDIIAVDIHDEKLQKAKVFLVPVIP